jgi:basic membrane protein A and related proteins
MHASPRAGRGAHARRLRSHAARAAIALAVAGLASACSSASSTSTPAAGGSATATPGKGASTIGFVMVGEENDQGYNQAVYTAAEQTAKDLGIKPLLAANVPETTQVTATMQAMVNEGAKVIFATSYGYYPFALAFAKAHPNVVVVHQGGLFTGPGAIPANFGTYWGEAFEPVSLGGMAAGAVTKSDKLGFVYAFPIAQTIDNIDAFELGAQLTNPKAVTYTEATSEWCDPLKQKTAAAALLSQGADVLSQHQDCQSTVIQAAKAGGASVVGYHYDAAALDPSGWLTGSAWQWAPVYEAIAKTAIAGTFTASKYNANWVGTFQADDNPLTLASFGPKVDPLLQSTITAKLATYKTGASIFKGPITCNNGKVLVPAGVTPTYAQINAFDCFVKGVVGTVPKS